MLRRHLAARLDGRLHYAWVVAALTFLTLLVVAGIRATPSVLIVPLEKNFGWSRDRITLAVSIGLALFGLMGPFAAAAMQRFGLRRTMVAALLLLAAAMGGSAFVTTPLGLVLTWGVLAGIGTGTMAMVLGVTVVNRWFESKRGSVLGLLTASTATGSLVFLPVLTWFIERGDDWRVVVYLVAGAALALIALVLLLMPERPAESRPVPLRRDGRRCERRDARQSARGRVRRTRDGIEIRHVLAAVRELLRLRPC
ncbi:MAG: MFS transporter [Rudaea sp.]|uniref:MFS transporter n=1 Tax=Rudaea sp. TaxID=2136325 RepID=UPI0039E6A9CD